MSTDQLRKSAQAVQDALHSNGLQCEVKELPDTTRSAKDAAAAIGCEVREIAKSIVFAIGGVPPLGHPAPITTLLDEDLLTFSTVWAAAGTPFSVFSIEPQALASATGGRVVSVS